MDNRISYYSVRILKIKKKIYGIYVLFSATIDIPIGQCRNVKLVTLLPYETCH